MLSLRRGLILNSKERGVLSLEILVTIKMYLNSSSFSLMTIAILEGIMVKKKSHILWSDSGLLIFQVRDLG